VRWRQYREVWAYVEEEGCRRARILSHFGDPAPPGPSDSCCDVCHPGLVPAVPAPAPEVIADLDSAIISVARGAQPAVGRTTCAEILHGSQNQKIKRNSYDGLPGYASSTNMRRADILARVDELIADGRLETTGGPYPVLRVTARAAA
jgi:ATP-dependent DNA helicase RecQ